MPSNIVEPVLCHINIAPKFDPVGRNTYPTPPKMVQSWPNWSHLCQACPNLCELAPNLVDSGRSLAADHWPKSWERSSAPKFRRICVQFGLNRTRFSRPRSTLAASGHALAEVVPNFNRTRPHVGRTRTRFGRTRTNHWAKSDQMQSTSCNLSRLQAPNAQRRVVPRDNCKV